MKRTIRLLGLVLVTALALVGQGSGVVTPGDDLVVEGIPPIPAAVAETVARYTDYRTASLQSWHPTRREMLISTRFGDTNQVHVVKMPGGARTQLTFFPDRVLSASFQPTTGDYFVFTKDIGGGGGVQKDRHDPATGGGARLTHGEGRNPGGG